MKTHSQSFRHCRVNLSAETHFLIKMMSLPRFFWQTIEKTNSRRFRKWTGHRFDRCPFKRLEPHAACAAKSVTIFQLAAKTARHVVLGLEFLVFDHRTTDHCWNSICVFLLVPTTAGRDKNAGIWLDIRDVYPQYRANERCCRRITPLFLQLYQTRQAAAIWFTSADEKWTPVYAWWANTR